MGRSPSNNKNGVKKGPWDPEEDKKLTDYINKNGAGSWISLPKLAGLNRCGKSCRLRWINYLRPEIKRGNFSPEEEQTILHFHRILGNKWSLIATKLPGRTDNEIKNYWNTHLRKKLIREGFDPITHQPQTDVVSCLKLLAIANLNSIINQNPLAYKLQCLQQQLLRSSQIDQIPSSMVNSISLPLIKENPILYSLPQLENEASFSLGTTISQPLHHPMTSTAPSPFSNNSLQDPQPKDVHFTFSPQAMTTSLDGYVSQIPEFGELDSLWNMVCSVPSTSDLVPSTVTETTSISNLGEVTSTPNYNGSDAPYSPWPGLLNDPDMP